MAGDVGAAKLKEAEALKEGAKKEVDPVKRDEMQARAQVLENRYGTGGDYQRGINAVTAAIQGLLGGNIGAALSGAAAPYLAGVIKEMTTDPVTKEVNKAANVLGHAVLGAAIAQAQGGNALAGAVGGGGAPLAASFLLEKLYPGKTAKTLDEDQKQMLVALTTLAGSMAGALATQGAEGGATAGLAAKNEVENNTLSTDEKAQIRALAEGLKLCGKSSDPVKCRAEYNSGMNNVISNSNARAQKKDGPTASPMKVALLHKSGLVPVR